MSIGGFMRIRLVLMLIGALFAAILVPVQAQATVLVS
jgi:hypothetical protein